MREENYRDSKNFKGNKDELFAQLARDYDLGTVKKYSFVEIGYEDDNNILETTKGTYFVKIFGAYRSIVECERYIDVLEKSIGHGVKTPRLFTLNGKLLYTIGDTNIAVFEYIKGKSFYELNRDPSKEEKKQILAQAAKINRVDCKPDFVYDDWAIVNIAEQYEIVEAYLSEVEKSVIEPLVGKFKELDLSSLPHCLVHGDIISTNVVKSDDEEIYIVDFACANYLPRIIELAVLSCNLLSRFQLEEIGSAYGQYSPLTDEEKKLLPLFTNLAYAMYVISAVRERDIYGNKGAENQYLLDKGLKGLNITIAK